MEDKTERRQKNELSNEMSELIMINNFDNDANNKYLLNFLNYMDTVKGKSKKTIKEYFLDLRMFFRFLKLYNKLVADDIDFNAIDIVDVSLHMLNKVKLNDIYEYMNYLNNVRNNTPTTRARKIASLKSFFKFMHKKLMLIESNPTEDLETPKSKRQLPHYLSIEESLNLLSTIDGYNAKRDYCIVLIFLNCGLRLNELVNINISDVRGNILTVVGKGNKERIIYLNELCINAIEEYLLERKKIKLFHKTDALFLSSRKKRVSARLVQWIVEKYIKKIGLSTRKYTVHKLRHTAATLMYQNGVDLRVLQEILGHAHLSTTEIYTHTNAAQLKEAIEKHPLSKLK